MIKDGEEIIGEFQVDIGFFGTPWIKTIVVIKTKDGWRTEPKPNLGDLWQLPSDVEQIKKP